MTFKEGGAFDFSSTYERIKETLLQASEVARESGRPVDLSTVDLEQLPAYEEIGAGAPARMSIPTSITQIQRPTPISPTGAPRTAPSDSGVAIFPDIQGDRKTQVNNTSSGQLPPPNEPPPGYDEAQQSSIADNLEESIRQSH